MEPNGFGAQQGFLQNRSRTEDRERERVVAEKEDKSNAWVKERRKGRSPRGRCPRCPLCPKPTSPINNRWQRAQQTLEEPPRRRMWAVGGERERERERQGSSSRAVAVDTIPIQERTRVSPNTGVCRNLSASSSYLFFSRRWGGGVEEGREGETWGISAAFSRIPFTYLNASQTTTFIKKVAFGFGVGRVCVCRRWPPL